jgi:hypothetical protein
MINRDGSTEAWDGDNYVALGSMKGAPSARFPSRVIKRSRRRVPRPPRVWTRSAEGHPRVAYPVPDGFYMEVEEYPALTINEFASIAQDQRRQAARRRRFDRLLRLAAKLASSKREGDQ